MSDEKQPELTPAEQQKQDEGRVNTQLVVTDMTELGREVLSIFPFGGGGRAGRTSFEGHDLNAIIDLVENANPADLENAGEALWKARDAIRSAAKELGDHIDGVDWQGDSGEAFRKWGKGLVTHATKLGDFADAAGTQITVAGTGLASVRNSMPPRDRRMIQTDVDDILFPARTETNPQYAAALTVEKNRQEAINQINRLASYYAVSEEVLAGQEPPRFDQRLGVDMPKPQGLDRSAPGSAPQRGETLSNESTAQSSPERATAAVLGGDRTSTVQHPVEALGQAPVLDKSTSTEINSVATPTVPNTATGTPLTPPATSGPGPVNTPTPPMAPGFGNPVSASYSRATGPAGGPRPVNHAGGGLGKASPTGASATARGGTGAPVGRPSPMAGGPSATGRSGGGVQLPTAGQSGVTGGRPIAAHGGTAAPGTSRAGQGNGIVGGTPQRATSAASGVGGARGVPRGTVIGGPGASGSAPRSGQRGAPVSGANGVVGAARGASGSGSKGFTAGGAGLVRGPAGRRKTDRKDEENTGSTRPDYLTEDEETWAARRRGVVPPVVE
ncbi:WXG100 family type VII secretion target [Streptomyces cyaneofuscatus]|uniref:WXG100 family type VII secretion target n=1 Tax=Streptomyces cyaneofuscatus TaxID=66883 RepID=UPI0036312273